MSEIRVGHSAECHRLRCCGMDVASAYGLRAWNALVCSTKSNSVAVHLFINPAMIAQRE